MFNDKGFNQPLKKKKLFSLKKVTKQQINSTDLKVDCNEN